jgi:hypothetical protein
MLAVLAAVAAGALLLSVDSAAAAPAEWNTTVTPNADYFLSGVSKYVGVYKVEAENVGGTETSGGVTIKDNLPPGLVAKDVQLYFLPVGDIQTIHPGTPEERTVNWERSLRNVQIGGPGEGCQVSSGSAECKFPTPLIELLPLYCKFFEFYCGVGPGVKPGQRLIMSVSAEVPGGTEGALEDTAEVSGGGAGTVTAAATNAASVGEPPPGTMSFNAGINNSGGEPYTQAGGHPFAFHTEFNFETYSNATPNSYARTGVAPVHDPKDISADLPPGLVINPNAVPHCSLADYYSEACENKKDAVGNACIRAFARGEGHCHFMEPVYNLEPEKFFPAQLGITVGGAPFIVINARVRSDGDYGAEATDVGIQVDLTRVRLTLWGVPADEGHNSLRSKACAYVFDEWINEQENYEECEEENPTLFLLGEGGPAEVPPTPFLTLPTECSGEPLKISGRYDTWSEPGQYVERTAELLPMDSCNQLTFEPTIEARPTTTLADAPSGLNFHLHIPQNEDPEGVATPELKESVLRLPQGIAINPAAAQGLQGCTEAQIGLGVEEPAHCPDASKLGEAEIESPLLHEPLTGALYLATPHENPAHALLAGYLSVAGQGVRVKVAGKFETDPQTGQVTTRFLENPQLPFENLKLSIFGGALGTLRTPTVCGVYQSTSVLTPYSAPESGPPAEPHDVFQITGSSNPGAACPKSAAAVPDTPLLRAGTETPQAGAYSPFALRLVREDGTQEVTGVDTTLPPGLSARLAGVPYCPDAAIEAARSKSGAQEKSSPSCPAASQVGQVVTATGAGPTPLNVTGNAYLAGPYKGAPLSLAVITPAIAGPVDLGTVVVRVALYVDQETARIHAVSDTVPRILEGVPLDIRSISLRLDRPSFTLNPTSCEPFAFTGSAFAAGGAVSPLSQRFQVGGCNALGFKPKLKLSLSGSTKRRGHPALKAVLTTRPGDANIASTQVTLPAAELLDNGHLRNVCTRVQFAANQCPANSVYGKAKAVTPLLAQPLEGPVYLGTGYGDKLPDLLVDLNGQIHVVLRGRVDSAHGGGLRTTFDVVPDAPVSSFVLEMQGGGKGLIENSVNLCSQTSLATILMKGQNGKSLAAESPVKVPCGGKSKRKRHPHAHHRRAALRHLRAVR